ncbi:hypothetical protein PQJ75_26020 [Rhodoplanes sp. TEM]|uniref:Uncharacterized protein n=1 Tax=Rhodoplanes tepidamans TaxID=200616 RepID=A0ABT5JBG3_RHOTP|nr:MULTISPECIES: hypothetical protein [Rhodoplanes]MDC7786893.1 hypothetical protein [Rhodoplanes tepidamans]MDC7987205.1 hypothetical protein [Rhodoplanes sp. TEM]MDQ0355411.1 hypothetical protein [Rhodoplanes tepidamans]
MTINVSLEALIELCRLTDRRPLLARAIANTEPPGDVLLNYSVVYALWPDPGEPGGHGLMMVEGFDRYVPGAMEDVGVFLCRDRAEAAAWFDLAHPAKTESKVQAIAA